MDIYGWVRALRAELGRDGEDELARRIADLPALVCGGDHAQVDGMVPALLDAARTRHLPWLEVFVRHWHLQSRVAKRGEGQAALTYAVDAIDRAHGPAGAGCPQAVCSVQDLCMAYANVDGVGYAAERLAVTAESLDAIDPSWPCFSCISTERAIALVDAGRPGDAVRFLADQRVLIADRPADDLFRRPLVDAALAQGRPAEARRVVEAAEARPDPLLGSTEDVRRRLDRALALAAGGATREAAAARPAAVDVPARDRPRYADLLALLVAGGELTNDGDLGSLLEAWTSDRLSAGAFDGALRTAAVCVFLATARGDRTAAAAGYGTARHAAAGLRDPGRVDDVLARLSALTGS